MASGIRAGKAYVELFALNNTKGGMDAASKYLERSSKQASSNSARLMQNTFQNVKFSFTNPFAALTNQATAAAETAAKAMSSVFERMPGNKWLGLGAGVVGGGALVGAGSAIAGTSAAIGPAGFLGAKGLGKFADVQQELMKIEAVGNKSVEEMTSVKEAISNVAKTSKWTNSEVAAGYLELTKSGFSTADANAAIKGVSDLAIATNSDMGTAGGYVGAVLKAYGFEADKAGMIADKLVTAANNSNQGIEDLFESLKMTMPVAKQAGVAFDDLLATTMSLANVGIKGSVSATNVTNSLLRGQTDAKAMQVYSALGVDVRDDNGNVRTASELTPLLQEAMNNAGYTADEQAQVFKKVFGKQGLGNAALGSEQAQRDYEESLKKLAEAQGNAAGIADSYMNGLTGTIERIKSTFDDFLVSVGDRIAPKFEQALNVIAETLPTTLDALLPKFEELGVSLPDLSDFIVRLISTLGDAINKSVDISIGLSKLDWNGILNGFLNILKATGHAVGVVFDALGTEIKKVLTSNIGNKVKSFIDTLMALLAKLPGVETMDTLNEKFGNSKYQKVLAGGYLDEYDTDSLRRYRDQWSKDKGTNRDSAVKFLDQLISMNEANRKAAQSFEDTSNAIAEVSSAFDELKKDMAEAGKTITSTARKQADSVEETKKLSKEEKEAQAKARAEAKLAERETAKRERDKQAQVSTMSKNVLSAYQQALANRDSVIKSNYEKYAQAVEAFNNDVRSNIQKAYEAQAEKDKQAFDKYAQVSPLAKSIQTIQERFANQSDSYSAFGQLADILRAGNPLGGVRSGFYRNPNIDLPVFTPPQLESIPEVGTLNDFAQQFAQAEQQKQTQLATMEQTISGILNELQNQQPEQSVAIDA